MVYTLGESLLDIIYHDSDNISACAGGGMLNTSVSLARSGLLVSLISELGDDNTAQMILNFLKENKVGVQFIKKYYQQNTSIAVAHLNEKKVPVFSIYKSYPENRHLLTPANFSIKDSLVFGSLYSIDPEIRPELHDILTRAKKSGTLLFYDPNIRQHLIDKVDLQKTLYENIRLANIIKASEEDLQNIFGKKPYEEYYQEIKLLNNEAVFILTLGDKGAMAFMADKVVNIPANKVKVVSTIGAGDSFNAGIIYFLHKNKVSTINIKGLKEDQLLQMIISGTKFSSEVCSTIDNYVGKNFC